MAVTRARIVHPSCYAGEHDSCPAVAVHPFTAETLRCGCSCHGVEDRSHTARMDTFVFRCSRCGGWRILERLERAEHTCPGAISLAVPA